MLATGRIRRMSVALSFVSDCIRIVAYNDRLSGRGTQWPVSPAYWWSTTIRQLLSDYLTSEGYRVALAEDGAAMRRKIEQLAPDLVMLDLKLLREDGLSLACFLRERFDVGIIMNTGAGAV
jgi:CheY-like chemotaxis protein